MFPGMGGISSNSERFNYWKTVSEGINSGL